MITEKIINSLYKTYDQRPASADELDIALLFESLIDHHEIEIDDAAHLIINSLPVDSPFHRIALNHIHAIVEFEHKVAIVLHSSIIFLNKHDDKSFIHIKKHKPSIIDRFFGGLPEA